MTAARVPGASSAEGQPQDRAARRRAKARESLLAAAEEAFGRTSYRDVRIEDLAAAADVAVGSVYDYFGSKDGLYLTLVERAAVQLRTYMQQAYDATLSPFERVMAAGELYLRFHLEHPGSFQLLVSDAAVGGPSPLTEQLRENIGSQMDQLVAEFQSHIESAIAAGEMPADLDAFLAARFLWGAWNGVVSLGLRGDRMRLTDDEITACLRQGNRIVRGGLSAVEHRTRGGRARPS